MQSLLRTGVVLAVLAVAAARPAVADPHCNPGRFAAWCAGGSIAGTSAAAPSAHRRESAGGSTAAEGASGDYLLSKTNKSRAGKPATGSSARSAQSSSPAGGFNAERSIEHAVGAHLGY
ncbi:MAG: hypothetical protein AB7S71_07485 [Dongiaceae bacterium]